MAEDNSSTGAIFVCCCLLIIIVFVFGALSGENDSSTTNIEVDNSISENEALPIINMTNQTIKPSKIIFIYYDHNSTKFEGCYGLNYTVMTTKDGTSFMLDHAETDILGEKTGYTFKYPNGTTVVYDNNTDTQIFNDTGCYYVHEIRDDNNTVIKSLGNFTLYDKSHEPEIVPSGWNFVYEDHNSSKYDGDLQLEYAQTNNTVGDKQEDIRFYTTADVIGLAYFSNKSFNYKYGLSGIELTYVNGSSGSYYRAVNRGLCLPNGTKIGTFCIDGYGLTQDQKNFITDYDGRIDEIRHKQEIDAYYDAQDMAYEDYLNHEERKDSKSHRSFFASTNGYGIIYS